MHLTLHLFPLSLSLPPLSLTTLSPPPSHTSTHTWTLSLSQSSHPNSLSPSLFLYHMCTHKHTLTHPPSHLHPLSQIQACMICSRSAINFQARDAWLLWMDGWTVFRPPFCTIKAELGWGQPGLMRWSWDETLPQCSTGFTIMTRHWQASLLNFVSSSFSFSPCCTF